MNQRFLQGALGAALLSAQLCAPAADIDLYTNVASSVAIDLPNVLFIIDNTANWNTAFTNEMSALATTFRNLPVNKFNIGIMLSTETGGGNGGEAGGYLRAAIRTMNSSNKTKYEALINSLDKLDDKGNGGASGLTMSEAYLYFAGRTPHSGNQKVKTDYTGNTSGTSASQGIYGLGSNALASKDATTYRSPVASGSCAKNYIIYISNGPNQESASKDGESNALLSSAAGGGTAGAAAIAQMTLTPSGSQSNPSDEWARFMKKSALAVTTYTIDVNPPSTGQGPGWTALLKSMSGVNNYVAVSSTGGSTAIASAINDALSKIQSVNSVFAAVSLPASANIQGAYLNQLYIGMFRPDPDTKPRWMGNLKQYKLGSNLALADADDVGAINTQTGFIAECARSYWTPLKTSTDTYWANDPRGACIPPGSNADLYAHSNTPDGNIVEKGAQAYVLRGTTAGARTVYTCSSTFASCTALLNFNASTATTAALGAADGAERDVLINWARGQNTESELAKTSAETRPSAHGSVIHSNPLALSYGANVVVYYGGNDGMLRAVNGNQTAVNGTAAPGAELWAFMPPEFLGNIKRLHDNTQLVAVTPPSGTALSATVKPYPYGIDGPLSAYKSGSSAWLYATMRRGGRALYSFDVSNAANPSLKWKVGCPNLANDTDCGSGFSAFGQTWSTPLVTKASGYYAGASPILMIGGGYDDCEDADQNSCTAITTTGSGASAVTTAAFSGKGRKIFVLDAATGALLTTLDTDRAVVADIKVVPDATGKAKYAYAADMGGNLYRINIGTALPSAWSITKIASLGCATAAHCTDNRKFIFAPSVVPETDGSYSLYIGSGDREKPLGAAYFPHTAAVANYFFKVKDKPSDATWLSSEAVSNCPGKSLICLNSLIAAGSTTTACGTSTSVATAKGWAFGLRATEQVVTPAATRFGVATFSTHMPAVAVAGACGSNLGTTHVYNLAIADGAPAAGSTCNDIVVGGGLPPPPEKKDVCMNDDCSVKKSICIGCSTESSIQSKLDDYPSAALGQNPKRRVYWYIQK